MLWQAVKMLPERFKITTFLVAVIFLGIFLFQLQASITGFAVAGDEITKTQGANFKFSESGTDSVSLVHMQEGYALKTLRASGKLYVREDGAAARVYLQKGEARHLIIDSETITTQGENEITGLAVGVETEDEKNGEEGKEEKQKEEKEEEPKDDEKKEDAEEAEQDGEKEELGGEKEDEKENGEEDLEELPEENQDGEEGEKENGEVNAPEEKDEDKEEKDKQKFYFEELCVGTCDIADEQYVDSDYELVFEIAGDAEIKINNINYVLKPLEVPAPPIQVPPENAPPPEQPGENPPQEENPPPAEQVPEEKPELNLPENNPPEGNNPAPENPQAPEQGQQNAGGGSERSFSSGSLTGNSPAIAAAVASPGELGPTENLQAEQNIENQNTESTEIFAEAEPRRPEYEVMELSAETKPLFTTFTGSFFAGAPKYDLQPIVVMIVALAIGVVMAKRKSKRKSLLHAIEGKCREYCSWLAGPK